MGDVIVVGHGPSLNQGLGELIDSMTVVRLKHWPPPSHYYPVHFGSRIDYLVVKKPQQNELRQWIWTDEEGVGDWLAYWKSCLPKNKTGKPSHGLIGLFLTMHHLRPERIHVIGFDRVFGNLDTYKWWPKGDGVNTLGCHDWAAERRALGGLGVPIINLGGESG